MSWLWFCVGLFAGLMFGVMMMGLLAGGAKRVPRPSSWGEVHYPDVD